MSDDNADKESFGELDLSALSSLSLEPAWASGDKTEKISVERFSRDDRRDRSGAPRRERPTGGNAARDRRPPKRDFSRGGENVPAERRASAMSAERSGNSPAQRGRDGGFRRGEKSFGGKPFHKIHGHAGTFPPPRVAEVSFFPEEKPFSVLIKAVKNSARTYALFEIANLILEKPERFAISVKPLERKGVLAKKSVPAAEEKPAGAPAEKSAAPFFVSVPDGMPFLSELDAISYVFDRHADKFFTVETVEVEPPKGNFTMVAKCGFTGKLLAPPNYHAYQQILRDFHAANFPAMPFEKFMSRLETVKDQESIDAWIAETKNVVRYTVKDRKDDEPETLDGAGAAKAFLVSNRKNKVVRAAGTARIPGKLLEQMPNGPLKSCIENELAFQRRFPLNTANFLRGRLRRTGFSLFKRGAKGITLVCAIRRKFRTPDSVFSDTIQRIFDFLEKHPNAKIQDLPKLMLGIETSAGTPENEAAAGTSAENPDAVPAENSAATEAALSELLGAVRWLILEGYVSELSDGALFTYPKMTAAQAKVAAKEDDAETPDDIAAGIPPAPEAPLPAVPAENSGAIPSENSAETSAENSVPAEVSSDEASAASGKIAEEIPENVPAETPSDAAPETPAAE